MKKLILASLLFSFLITNSSFLTVTIGDPARTETRLDEVYAQYSLTGQGVTIGIIDRGIDYRHPDFITPSGQTRIAYLFDLLDDTGMNDPDNPYGMGTIFDAADINASLMSGGDPLSTDRGGHGTATTGIAAGNGSAVPANTFQGVAPEADLIIVKVTHDFFPPFGNQDGQDGIFDPAFLPVALEFMADKMEELGQPSVALINLGSNGGPTDGTSSICRAMDDFVDQGHVLVCGVGDDGGADNFASGMINQGETADLKIQKEAGFVRLDLWYPGDDRLDVSIVAPSGTEYGPYVSPATNQAVDFQNAGGIASYYHRGADQDFNGAESNRRQILIDFNGPAGEYTIQLNGASISDGAFKASLNPSRYSNTNRFTTFVTEGGSINDYASATKVITPTDYVVKNDWIDVNGVFRDITGQGESGELWIGSSEGPTHDGRQGVDIAVPGEVLFAAYRPDTWYSNFEFNQVQGGDGHYGVQNAVSACAPLLTGVIALMLEVGPELTPEQVRTILQETAISDSFTGATPNNTWGYGKLDAFAVIQAVDDLVSVDETQQLPALLTYPNPASDVLFIRTPPSGETILSAVIIGMDGRIAQTVSPAEIKDGVIRLRQLSAGSYLLRIQTEKEVLTNTFIIQ